MKPELPLAGSAELLCIFAEWAGAAISSLVQPVESIRNAAVQPIIMMAESPPFEHMTFQT
jgi:hypothetical protein